MTTQTKNKQISSWKELIGNHIFSGIETGEIEQKMWGMKEKVTCNYVKFTLDGTTYMAIEDPDDGYRSYLDRVEIVETPCRYQLPNIPVEAVINSKDNTEDVIRLIDKKNGKEVLVIGTAHCDDYYPYCVLQYIPENFACNGNQ